MPKEKYTWTIEAYFNCPQEEEKAREGVETYINNMVDRAALSGRAIKSKRNLPAVYLQPVNSVGGPKDYILQTRQGLSDTYIETLLNRYAAETLKNTGIPVIDATPEKRIPVGHVIPQVETAPLSTAPIRFEVPPLHLPSGQPDRPRVYLVQYKASDNIITFILVSKSDNGEGEHEDKISHDAALQLVACYSVPCYSSASGTLMSKI